MDPEFTQQLLWCAKVLQAVSAAILTPEIIGPGRLEKLEGFLEKQNYSRLRPVISVTLYIALLILLIPTMLLHAAVLLNLSGEVKHFPLLDLTKWSVRFLVLALVLKIVTWVIAAKFDPVIDLFQALLSKFVLYLRRTSLFRAVLVTLAVVFFILGTLLELVIEFPF